jgi:hypothetical protein
MEQIVDALCLLQINIQKIIRSLYYFQPKTFPLDEEIQYLVQNCIPEEPKSPTSFYAFSLLKSTGYSAFFKYKEETFALVIISKIQHPSIYFEFLRESVQYIEEKDSLEKCVDVLWKFLTTWKQKDQDKAYLNFPSYTRIKKLNDDAHVFDDYNPYRVFPEHQKFTTIWKSLFLGVPIKIIADDEEELTNAVFSVLALIQPYRYAGNPLFILNSHDPRLKNASEYLVVGVLKRINNFVNGNFACTIEQAPVIDVEYDSMREEQLDKMKRLQAIHLYLMDRILLINPYNDLLNGPYVNDSLEKEMKSKDNKGLFTAQEMRAFERSPTAIEFRKKNIYRDAFRNAFLSVPPEEVLAGKGVSNLQVLLEILDKLKKDFNGDAHMSSVIKTHKRIINNMLEEFRSSA